MEREVQACLVPEVTPNSLPLHLHQVSTTFYYLFIRLFVCLFVVFLCTAKATGLSQAQSPAPVVKVCYERN